MKFLYFLLISILFCACTDNKPLHAGVRETPVHAQTSLDIEPLLNEVDSLDLLFYLDPYGDSLRYTRFYSYAFLDDDSSIRVIKAQLNRIVIRKDNRDSCRSEGKIYLFGNREPIKTIYFSVSRPSCNHLYFIKDGNYYYLKPDAKFADLLSQVKKRSKTHD